MPYDPQQPLTNHVFRFSAFAPHRHTLEEPRPRHWAGFFVLDTRRGKARRTLLTGRRERSAPSLAGDIRVPDRAKSEATIMPEVPKHSAGQAEYDRLVALLRHWAVEIAQPTQTMKSPLTSLIRIKSQRRPKRHNLLTGRGETRAGP
jgi:hypothetical protein